MEPRHVLEGAGASRFIILDRMHNGWRPRRPMTDPVRGDKEGGDIGGSGQDGIRDKLRKLSRSFIQPL